MNPFEEADKSNQLMVSDEGLEALQSTGKWARFLAILGFIGIGFMVLGGLGVMLAGSMGGSSMRRAFGRSAFGMEGGIIFMGLIYLVMAALYFFPIYYLNSFASKIINATNNRNGIEMNSAFGMLRAHYRFIGILTIVILSMYALILLISLFAVGMRY